MNGAEQPLLARLTAGDFAPLRDTDFTLELPGEGGGLALRLTAVETLGAAAAGSRYPGGREPFSLLFAGPSDRPLPQGTFSLNHPALGTQAIFLVPVAGDIEGRLYQAIFT